MRDYGKVSPKFWTGDTGKALRGRGSEALIVALYLMSSPHSNMLGLYYQPLLYLAHETGLGVEGATKGLQGCIEAGFCAYDFDSEIVWVYEMAGYQIAKELKASDNRCGGIQKEYEGLEKSPFLGEFFDHYQKAFHLTKRRNPDGAFEAPSKPLPSQEQEQEQEQEQKKELALQLDDLPPAAGDGSSGKPSATRGTRLPADWQLTKALAAEGAAARLNAGLPALSDVEMRTEGAKFRDHWHSQAGAKGVKVDWLATWRNWCRNARSSAGIGSAVPASAVLALTNGEEDAT